MRIAPWSSISRAAIVTARVALVLSIFAPAANALVVQNMTGTTVAPADDPGWNYVTTGGRNLVYLGDGWVLSAFHVGVPTPGEAVNINGGTFNVISNQAFTVKNPTGQGLSAETDLRLMRINGDPGLAPINIAASQINESTPIGQRQVVIIGNGPTRQANQTQWNVTQVAGNGNDVWTEVTPPPNGTYVGYKTDGANVKRWGTNQIADEDSLFGTNDGDLRGNLQLQLGVGPRNVMSMVTQFDAAGLANEAQVVVGDSGSSVFYKRNGVWELIGIVNAQLTGIQGPNGQYLDGQNTTTAVYGNYSTFADLSYYRNDILSIMNANPNYSLLGDINLDGVVNGTTTGGGPTGDLLAFVNGWGYNNGTGVGTVTSWKNGDLNHDGKTDYLDFVLLRGAFNPSGGAGGLTLDSLLGVVAAVPEPGSAVILLVGAAGLGLIRRGRRR